MVFLFIYLLLEFGDNYKWRLVENGDGFLQSRVGYLDTFHVYLGRRRGCMVKTTFPSLTG